MRTVYLGTSEFAATVLRGLAASVHRPVLVVSPPDRPKGRGRHILAPPVADAARELGIEVLQTPSVNRPEAAERVRAVGAEVGVVCAFGQLIDEPLLTELRMLNVHPSLLPRWRGAAPIERAIMAGDEETGVTVIQMGAGYDSGPIALQQAIAIDPTDDFGSLSARLARLGVELILRALDLEAATELELTEQDDSLATYAEKVAPAERRLDPSRLAAELERTVRALNPHLGTYLELDGSQRLGVRAAVADGPAVEPGRMVADAGALLLGCGEGTLRLELVQAPGGRPMTAEAYLRGHPPPRLAG